MRDIDIDNFCSTFWRLRLRSEFFSATLWEFRAFQAVVSELTCCWALRYLFSFFLSFLHRCFRFSSSEFIGTNAHREQTWLVQRSSPGLTRPIRQVDQHGPRTGAFTVPGIFTKLQ